MTIVIAQESRQIVVSQVGKQGPGGLTTRNVSLSLFASDASAAVIDGALGLPIPSTMNGLTLREVLVSVIEPGLVSGILSIQVRRFRAGAEVEMLSIPTTLAVDEYVSINGVVDSSNDDVLTGDILFVDVTTVPATPPEGVSVSLTLS